MESKPPYIGKEFEDLVPHIATGLAFMRRLDRNDPKYDEYLDRFYGMMEYFVSTLNPLPDMRIIIDKRMVVTEAKAV